MGSKRAQRYYCRCGTRLAIDNTGRQCARCQRASRDKFITPPEVPDEFWDTEQFAEAFAARHMGRVSRVYRMHPHHFAVYGPYGISQTLLGQWLGLRQPQVSRFETGPPLQLLDMLQHWARVLRIPPELLWFRLPEDTTPLAGGEPTRNGLAVCRPSGLLVPTASQTNGGQAVRGPHGEQGSDAEGEPVLVAPWNHRGTVEAAVSLSGGGSRVKRRVFLSLTGPALTAPAHQWLVHEPEPLVSGLTGHRVSGELVDRFNAMVTELRQTDDMAGGGRVLTMAQHLFGWTAELLDQASYSEHTGRGLYTVLAELGQLCGWSAFDLGEHGLAQRYFCAGLRAAHSADDRPLGAHILGEMAYQAAHQGRPTEALTFIDTAVAGTRGQQTPRLLAQLDIQRAHAFAALNDASACTAAISQARTRLEQSVTDDGQSYLYWVRPAEITSSAGECLLQLGQADRATTLLTEGIAMFDAFFDRDRQYYLTHLVAALACPGKQRDLEAAAAKGIEAIQLAKSVSSPLNVDRIRSVARRLEPHVQVPAVREFLDRAEAVRAG